jgi:hypothetical protein
MRILRNKTYKKLLEDSKRLEELLIINSKKVHVEINTLHSKFDEIISNYKVQKQEDKDLEEFLIFRAKKAITDLIFDDDTNNIIDTKIIKKDLDGQNTKIFAECSLKYIKPNFDKDIVIMPQIKK